MKRQKYIILLAGSPGTGKSYLMRLLQERFPHLYAVTPDEIKENFAETMGFDSLAEKEEIEKRYVWPFYYQALGLYMSLGKQLIVTEYPFSEKQKPFLTFLGESYGYQFITIRLDASFDTLWARRYKRDRENDRHLSFIMSSYHYGDELTDRNLATNHITKKAFHQIINDRKYHSFVMGDLFEVNVEAFNLIDYDPILDEIAHKMAVKY